LKAVQAEMMKALKEKDEEQGKERRRHGNFKSRWIR